MYILSGLAGNIASAIFLPHTVTVGASGACYGLIGVLSADLILNWTIIDRPWLKAIFLIFTILLGLFVGSVEKEFMASFFFDSDLLLTVRVASRDRQLRSRRRTHRGCFCWPGANAFSGR